MSKKGRIVAGGGVSGGNGSGSGGAGARLGARAAFHIHKIIRIPKKKSSLEYLRLMWQRRPKRKTRRKKGKKKDACARVWDVGKMRARGLGC